MPDRNLFETVVETLPADQHRMRAWIALVACFTSVERSLRRRFNEVFGASLPRYDVLTALSQFPEGLTMGQLASKLMVSKGNITGVVRRLQANDCVRQSQSKTDRRVQTVTITEPGRAQWQKMQEEYRQVIEELMQGLTEDETQALTGMLGSAQLKIDAALQIPDGNDDGRKAANSN